MVVITISGNAGSGKDTTAKLLSEKSGFKLIRGTMKTYAKEMGLDILEFEKQYAGRSEEWDRRLDEWQREAVKKCKDCILVSMLSAYNVPNADLKVFLTAPLEVRAERISKRDKIPEERAIDYVKERDRTFRERIKRIYGIDFWDPKLYDIVIDTSKHKPNEVVQIIMKELEKRRIIK